MNASIGRMLSLLLVLQSVASVVILPITASFVEANDTVVAKVGSNVTLQCPVQSEEEGVWTYYNSTNDVELNDCNEVYIKLCRRIAVETDGTVSVLNITDIRPEDAGQYKCQNIHRGGKAIVSKKLIVIDDGPKCSSTIHKDLDNTVSLAWNKMELHCEVGFNGSLNATGQCIVEWRIVGREDVLDSKCIIGNNSVKSTLTLDAVSHSNDTSYVCVVRGSAIEQYSCQTGQTGRPSPEYNEDAVTLQPGPITKSPNMKIEPSLYCLLQRQFRTRSLMDNKFLRLQLDTFWKVSELADTQQKLLSIETERLELERSKVLPRRRLNRTHLENIGMLKSNGHSF